MMQNVIDIKNEKKKGRSKSSSRVFFSMKLKSFPVEANGKKCKRMLRGHGGKGSLFNEGK